MPKGVYVRTKPPWNKGKKGVQISWCKGKKFPKWLREKLSKAHTGKKHSETQRKKMSDMFKGKNNPAWRGGKHLSRGYVCVYVNNHPFVKQYAFEHRIVMEKHIGRVLLPKEVVHHINGICEDNRIENLMLFSSQSEHRKYHEKERKNAKPCAS